MILKKLCQHLKFALIALLFAQSIQSAEIVDLGGIRGTVTTADGQPVEYLNVSLVGTKRGTITNPEGKFEILKVKSGTYTLAFTYIGLEKEEVEVEIIANTITDLSTVALNENLIQMQEFIVTARRLNQFAQKETEHVARLPVKNIENPQSYTVVTNELMTEQVATNLPSSLKSITGGGYVQTNEGNVSAYLRGFRSDGYVRNGMVSYTRVPIDPANIERVEVIKGPSAVLFGAYLQNISGYGGVLNRVTKKPKIGDFNNISLTAGSWNLARLTFDHNKSLDKENKALFRINGAVHSEDSFQDQGIQRDYMIAPSFVYHANENLSIQLEAERFHTKRNLNFARGVAAVTGDSWDDLDWDFDTAYNSNAMAGNMTSKVYHGLIDYKLNTHWASKTSFTASNINVDNDFFRLEMENDTTVSRNFIQYKPRNAGSVSFQQDLTGTHKMSLGENKLLLGVSYVGYYDDYQRAVQPGPPFIEYDRIVVTGNSVTIPAMTRNAFEQFVTGNKARARYETSQNVLAAYASDALHIGNRFTLLGGLRLDRFDTDDVTINGVANNSGYDQTSLSYKLGGSFEALPEKLSFFGNFMTGFSNVAPTIGESGSLENFDPEEAKQWEIGAKVDLYDDKLIGTASYYNINISNAVRNLGTYSIQDGEITSKGLDIDIIANPTAGLNLVAGYTVTDATNDKTANPAIDGKKLTLSPDKIANLWVSYQVPQGQLSGFGLGAGINHMGKVYEARSQTNTFFSEPYTTMDATVFFNQEGYRIGVKLNNVLNKKYYNGYGIPQQPFGILTSITLKL